MKRTFDARHHSARPVSAIKPNLAVNQKPNYIPPAPEKAAINNNPSLGPIGLDSVNARVGGRRQDAAENVSDPASPQYDPDSLDYDPTLDSSSDDFEGDEDRNDAEIKIS